MACPVIALGALRNQASHLSSVPMDVINIVQQKIDTPGVAIFGRHPEGESIVYHSLDYTFQRQKIKSISSARNCLYGSPVPNGYRPTRVTVSRHMMDPTSSPLDTITSMDLSTGTERRPAWVSAPSVACALPAMPAVTVALDETRLLVPRQDQSFVCVNTESKQVYSTALTFGRRNPLLGRAFLGAKTHMSSGNVVISSSNGGMCYYDCTANTATMIAPPKAIDGGVRPITCMQTVPNSDQFMVGYHKRAMLYDFRTGFAPVVCTEARFPLWTSASFFTDYSIASWNSLSYDHTGFHVESHCQFVDIRMPSQWGELASWNLPANVSAQWAVTIAKVPN